METKKTNSKFEQIKFTSSEAKNKTEALKKLNLNYSKIENHPFSNFLKNKIVFGVGNPDSQLVFLGEGPGREEDLHGKPFVGRAGQLLTKIINAMGFNREDVYITNVIKCRLPNNRPPTSEEIEIEKKLILNEELKILSPKIICALGASAMQALLGQDLKISTARGNFFNLERTKIMPTYHPAYLLRNEKAKPLVWSDMKKILAELNS